MILIKTMLGESRISGIGLFCKTPIKKDVKVWQRNELTGIQWSKEEYAKMKASLPETAFDNIGRFVYLNEGTYCLDLDDSRFMNHSENPSMGWNDKDKYCYALRDLSAGTELTLNYRDFCDEEDLINCNYVETE